MIDSGWIFPDGTEYFCDKNKHDLIVSMFIRGLRFQDLETQKKINQEINQEINQGINQGIDDFLHGSTDRFSNNVLRRLVLKNYALRKLGWIRVDSKIQHINYAGYDWQAKLVNPYDEYGYETDNRHLSSSFYLPIKCNILLAIKNGDTRFDEDRNEYRYDGTDKNDSYIDENGNVCMAHWS